MDRVKTFCNILNVYFWERCYIANDFISNLKLIYKFIDANQKILKEREEKKSTFICLGPIVKSIIQIKKSMLLKLDPMFIGKWMSFSISERFL